MVGNDYLTRPTNLKFSKGNGKDIDIAILGVKFHPFEF